MPYTVKRPSETRHRSGGGSAPNVTKTKTKRRGGRGPSAASMLGIGKKPEAEDREATDGAEAKPAADKPPKSGKSSKK